MPYCTSQEAENPIWTLRSLSQEVRALGHLISMQKKDEALRLDIEAIYEGLGGILEHLSDEIMSVSRKIEKEKLKSIT